MSLFKIMDKLFNTSSGSFMTLTKHGEKIADYRLSDDGLFELEGAFKKDDEFLDGYWLDSERPTEELVPILEKRMDEISKNVHDYQEQIDRMSVYGMYADTSGLEKIKTYYEKAMKGADKAIAILSKKV